MEKPDSTLLTIPKVTASSSSETLTDVTVLSAPCSPSNLSSVTLVGSTGSDSGENNSDKAMESQDQEKTPTPAVITSASSTVVVAQFTYTATEPVRAPAAPHSIQSALSKHAEAVAKDVLKSPLKIVYDRKVTRRISDGRGKPEDDSEETESPAGVNLSHRTSCTSSRSGSISTTSAAIQNYYCARKSIHDAEGNISARTSFQHDSPQNSSKAGVVITSFRQSKRRSSTSGAATAFAIATSGSSNPRDLALPSRGDGRSSISEQDSISEKSRYKENVISTACTMRVLNVLRHWVSKHAQDFENDPHLKNLTIEFLDDIIYSPNLLPAEHKAAAQLLRLIRKEEPEHAKVDLDRLLAPPMVKF